MNLVFRVCSDLIEAERIWKQLCPQETLYDCWEFRATFHKYHQNPLYFIVGEDQGQLVGAWPLQTQKETEALEFFGGDYMEDNRLLLASVFAGQPEVAGLFYDHLRGLGKPLDLQCLTGADEHTTALPLQDNKFILPVANYQSYEDYLAEFYSTERQSKIRKRMRQIDRLGLTITPNRWGDLEHLFDLNIKMFGNHSSFSDRQFHKEIFRDLVKNPVLSGQLLTFHIGEKIEAISLGFFCNQAYAFAIVGVEMDGISDLSRYMNLHSIDRAIKLKVRIFDAFTGDYGWKERWHFQKIPQYRLGTIPMKTYGPAQA